ncbi:MAG: DUF58 domain-containing protein [Polyangiales bacterium]
MQPAPETRYPSIFTLPLVLGCVGVALFFALLTAQATLTFLCLLLLALAGGAKAWSYASLTRITSVLRLDPRRLFPGESLALAMDVANNKLLPVWLQVSVPLPAALRAHRGVSTTRDSGLSSYQKAHFDWRVVALRRGVHAIGPVALRAADPLGFFPNQKLSAASEVIVYPRLIPLPALVLPRRDPLGKPGVRSAVEDPTYLNGVRDYQPGRPARHIHWKASARHDRLLEKMLETTARERVLIVLCAEGFDTEPDDRALELCLEVVASLAVQLDRQRHPVGFVTNARLKGRASGTIGIARMQGQLSELLETLARFEPIAERDIVPLLYGSALLSATVSVVTVGHSLAATPALFEYLRYRRVPMVNLVSEQAEPATGPVYRLSDLRGAS